MSRVKTSELDHWLREHGIDGEPKAGNVVYTNPRSGRSTTVPLRPVITNSFARDICFQLEVPIPVSIKAPR
jgi:hypothetical protein